MKRENLNAILLLIVLVAALNAGATTCVINKKFKVKAVCGTVTDPFNAPILNADVELQNVHSVVLRHVTTSDEGLFDIPNVTKGEYILRVKSRGFIVASQPFVVTKSGAKGQCKKECKRDSVWVEIAVQFRNLR